MVVSNFGATIISLKVPNKNKTLTNVVVGLKRDVDYLTSPYIEVALYLGASIGRYAGRISKGKFEVDGIIYPVKNNNGVHLHGNIGFDKRYWKIEETLESSVTFTYFSPNDEEGYPGNLQVKVVFELTATNCLKITYTASTDASTPVNLTSHPYLNLNGTGTVLNHLLKINSVEHLAVDDLLLPTGNIVNSNGTQFDRKEKGPINRPDFKGFDDTFILENDMKKAELFSSLTGIGLSIYSNQPAMVVYTPKIFPELPFQNNYSNIDYPAICFEPQNYPDAPNNSHFPDSILNPGEEYCNEIIYEFTTFVQDN